MTYSLSKPNRHIKGQITLDGSKSISNRALIIRALSGEDFPIEHLSTSNDTVTMQALLAQASDLATLDTGAAGTTFRFLTAYLALQPGTQVLTGSERMKQRPIGVLVEALRNLGAQIDYLGQEGYPPLRINPPQLNAANHLQISAGVSSQYISALLMIAPTLPKGLTLELEGKIVSRPYIEMTLRLMAYFGVQHQWEGQRIIIAHQAYQGRAFRVEADWSAASYHYALAAFADELELDLFGLDEKSLQGDAVLAELMRGFGIETTFIEGGLQLRKGGAVKPMFEKDFIRCPDIAQTLAVVCGGLGINGLFTGLDTLSIKETDRIAALKTELAKVQVWFSQLPPKFSKNTEKAYYMVEGKAVLDHPTFATYEDHRMAMAFAPLAMFGPIQIIDPHVVAKSYPGFWEDLKTLGFVVAPFKV
ncbi:MAG: 3-phosphoshikimate 1-carboxyvinyltransferase [Bacteroidota bacterium]